MREGREVKISCRGLWKVFGPSPAEFLARHQGRPTAEAFASEGYIPAVRDVSFDVHHGENLVIMGLSGSGKSTLVRCLSRLIEPSAGQVLFEGRDLLRADRRELTEIRRHRMGMVFQHFGLLPHRTVVDNVAFPLEVQGVAREKRLARAGEVLELVGLQGREHYYPRELSGGQQQRVGIARSLAVEPEVWFLDEPFSSLDPLIRREMQDEFLRLQSMLRKTIVFITHDFDEALRLADRIAIMNQGEVVQIGTPEELVLQPATAYVAEFTKTVPRAKLLRARSIMLPLTAAGTDPGTGGAPVPADSLLESVARRVIEAEGPVPVAAADGTLVGELHRSGVMDALFGPDARP